MENPLVKIMFGHDAKIVGNKANVWARLISTYADKDGGYVYQVVKGEHELIYQGSDENRVIELLFKKSRKARSV